MSFQLEPLSIEDWPFSLLGIAYGQGQRLQLEVLYSEHGRPPNSGQLRAAWKARQGRRGVPQHEGLLRRLPEFDGNTEARH